MLAHAHRVTAMTFVVMAAFVGSLVARCRRDDVSADVMFQAEGSLGPHMRQALMLTFLWGRAAFRNYLMMAILSRWWCIGFECSIVVTWRFWTRATSVTRHSRIRDWSETFGLLECPVAGRCLNSRMTILVANCVHNVDRLWCLGSSERSCTIFRWWSIHCVTGWKSARIRPDICATNLRGLRSIMRWLRSLMLIYKGLVLAKERILTGHAVGHLSTRTLSPLSISSQLSWLNEPDSIRCALDILELAWASSTDQVYCRLTMSCIGLLWLRVCCILRMWTISVVRNDIWGTLSAIVLCH